MGILRRYAAFRHLWVGQILSQFGNAVFLVMGLWEIQLRSPFLLSIAGLAITVPSLLTMVGGVIVDRAGPGRLMLATDLLRGLGVGIGLIAVIAGAPLVWVVIGCLAVDSLGNTLFNPAESVLLPRLVSDRDLEGANGLYAITATLANASGSAIGGAAIAAVGVTMVFGLDLGSFWLSACALWLTVRTVHDIRRRPIEPGPVFSRNTLRHSLEGFRDAPWLLSLLPWLAVWNFALAAAFTMLPAWSHRILHAGALGFGLLEAGWAAGTVIGGVLTASAARWPLRTVLTAGATTLGTLTGVFALVDGYAAAGLILLAAGGVNGVLTALVYTLIQRAIPESVRGRAFGLFLSLLTMAQPLGALAAGLLLNVLPLAWSWILGGLSAFAVARAMWKCVPVDWVPAERRERAAEN